MRQDAVDDKGGYQRKHRQCENDSKGTALPSGSSDASLHLQVFARGSLLQMSEVIFRAGIEVALGGEKEFAVGWVVFAHCPRPSAAASSIALIPAR